MHIMMNMTWHLQAMAASLVETIWCQLHEIQNIIVLPKGAEAAAGS